MVNYCDCPETMTRIRNVLIILYIDINVHYFLAAKNSLCSWNGVDSNLEYPQRSGVKNLYVSWRAWKVAFKKLDLVLVLPLD